VNLAPLTEEEQIVSSLPRQGVLEGERRFVGLVAVDELRDDQPLELGLQTCRA
jgi:hypothetical protein